MRRTGALVVGLVVAVLAPGCGGDAPHTGQPTGATGGVAAAAAPAPGADLSVARLRGGRLGGDLVLVRAYVVVTRDGAARVCDALAESRPPRCEGASLPLGGGAPTTSGPLAEAGGVRWSPRPEVLAGRVREGRFVIDPRAAP
jgi:hypothetical protein